jgi:DNA helicase-2/ATP-dependent DNA helicase PcrA
MDLLFKNLNEAQKMAVVHKKGPLLVLAGAGAGKTRVISHRLAYLVKSGIKPEQILAITFTNKAAEEMKERIKLLLGKPAPFVSTFHALGVYILRKSGRLIGIPKNFSILDKEDSLDLIKDSIKETGLDPRQFQPSRMQAIISKLKGDLVRIEDFEISAGNDFFPRKLSLIWNKYEGLMKKQGALDFDDLVARAVFLFESDKETRRYYQNFWQHLLIDEYQDTNKSQYQLAKILAEEHRNICAIGDLDQAIYGWRGADFRNILNFENDYPDHTTIIFEENYRSTKNILEAASRVIEKNKMRKEKKLISTRHQGEELSLFRALNEEEEAEFVASKIKELLIQRVKPSEIAVLFRTNFQSRVLEEACLKNNIPYQMLGTQFYERREVKDILAYLRTSLNAEDLISLKRIINVPPRGIGRVAVLNYLSGKPNRETAKFTKLLKLIKNKIANSKPSDILRFIIKESGYQKYLEGGGEEGREKLENLKELVSIAKRYNEFNGEEGIEKMLTDISLMSEQDTLDKKGDRVRLMTVHSAKGLEFDYVFITGLEEGLFPHVNAVNDIDERQEEERRLFYVALTRAKEKVFLSFCDSRLIFGARQMNLPTRFLEEIPQSLIKLEESL